MKDDSRSPDLHAYYDAMWTRAHGAIAAGDIERDERVLAGPDSRRGLTLVARPGAALQARFDALLERLAQAEPGQSRHPTAVRHLNVLPLCTVTEEPGAQLARLGA